MTKVLFLTNIPMIRQHRIDMYVDAIAKHFDVELWDLSQIYGNNEILNEMVQECIKIKDIYLFSEKLKEIKLDNEVFVITNILLHNLKLIYPILHRLNIPIININKDSSAAWMYSRGAICHIKMVGLKKFAKAFIHYNPILRRLLSYYRNGNVKYDFQLASYNFYPEDSRCFVKIHNIKYDEFRASQNEQSIISGDYILFIDAALADHPMFSKFKNGLNRSKYLTQLNQYFAELENKYGMPVVISAHPKSNYSQEDFPRRQIISYKTPVLIRFAKYIVAHYSTSLYDVILQKKPLKVLYSRDMLQSACYNTVITGIQVANYIAAECVDLDRATRNDFFVSEKEYEMFTKRFLLNEDKMTQSNGDLIISFLKDLQE